MSIGEAISVARVARGLTQAELAEESGVTQAALSRYENDLRDPSDDVIAAIARALGVTPELLTHAGRIRGAVAMDAHMRRRSTAPPTVWRRLEANLNLYRIHLRKVLEQVRLKSSQGVPSFDPMEVDPSTAARFLRMQWQMPVGPIRNLVQWAESAGVVVIEEDFGTTRVDGLSQWVDESPIVMLNAAAPTDRKRLTLAHELGHITLHSRDITDDVEADANAFAAELLMPADVIRHQLRNLSTAKLHDLKREWGVSMQALIERAHQLGTITPADRTRFYKQFSAFGWRRNEPLSDALAPEIPALATEIGEALIASGLTREEAEAVMGFDPTSRHTAPFRSNPFMPEERRLRSV